MNERWDGEGNHISGKFSGVLRDRIAYFEKEELLNITD
jgi:hypothetical protein